jgi:hypothetical protein
MEPDFKRAVREALADVNYDMAPVLARLSPEQRFAMIGDLADHARETSITGQDERAAGDGRLTARKGIC